jgi:transcriptional regulator
MYIPEKFKESRQDVLHAFMRAHPLATVVVSDAAGLCADHVPLSLCADGPRGELLGHVARANPLWKKAGANGIDCLVVFQGLQGYVSPNWYVSKADGGKVVPTWNYEAVHAQGRLHAIDDADWLRRFLTELTAEHEAGQPAPWQLGDAPDDYIAGMLKALVGLRIDIVGLVGKAKLSQNQPPENRASVVEALRARGDAASAEMARAVQDRGD